LAEGAESTQPAAQPRIMQPSHTDEAAAAAEEPPGVADIPMAMQPAHHPHPMPPPFMAVGPHSSSRTDNWPQPDESPRDRDPALFDRWLRQELGRLHDNVLREPVPDRLRSIIEGGRKPGG